MSRVTILRTSEPFPAESILASARSFLFGIFDGWRNDDKKGWRRIWKRLIALEPGEFAVIEFVIPRSLPAHRRHMKIISDVFDAQERFQDFDQFWIWLKVGAGWVDWCAGPKGGVVPIPKSISFAKADQHEFEQYHNKTMAFLRGPHAANFLWKHLGNDAHWSIDAILSGFGE